MLNTNKINNFILEKILYVIINDIIEYSAEIRRQNSYSDTDCFEGEESYKRYFNFNHRIVLLNSKILKKLFFINYIGGITDNHYSKYLQNFQYDINNLFACFKPQNNNRKEMCARLFMRNEVDFELLKGLERLNKHGISIV